MLSLVWTVLQSLISTGQAVPERLAEIVGAEAIVVDAGAEPAALVVLAAPDRRMLPGIAELVQQHGHPAAVGAEDLQPDVGAAADWILEMEKGTDG